MGKDTIDVVCAVENKGYGMGVIGNVVNDETTNNKWLFKDKDSNWASEELATVINEMLKSLYQDELRQGEEFEVLIKRKQK